MIFRKPSEESFIEKAPTCDYPFYLEPKLQSKLERIARKKGKDVGEMVNQLLRKDIEFLEEPT